MELWKSIEKRKSNVSKIHDDDIVPSNIWNVKEKYILSRNHQMEGKTGFTKLLTKHYL